MYLSDKNMLNASKKMKNTDFMIKNGIFYYFGGIFKVEYVAQECKYYRV